ncbi:HD-GYP domain-containing protein [Desulfoglaeba alkanexedens]|uniref:HD-GYP domain-containing protein n=1 Tax=Desulfoglaeba alkanexedens TaxID=361111 RepID=UPI001476EC2B|nr:HD-GYP domain-containing protein [Desulfoglaeba alkanexedens]
MREGPLLNLRQASSRPFNGNLGEAARGYIPVKVAHLWPGIRLPCEFHLPILVKGEAVPKFVKVFDRGQFYSEQWWETLRVRQVTVLYVEEADYHELTAYMEEFVENRLDSSEMSGEEKSGMLYGQAELLVSRIFSQPHDLETLQDVSRWTEQAARHLQRDSVTARMLYAVFSKDYQTYTHSVQVCLLGMAFAAYLGWDETETAELGKGGLLHDIGKIWIDDRILLKPASLTAQEFEKIKEHPKLGHDQLQGLAEVTESVLEIVLRHHESMDGNGYPEGLSGESIHPYARVAHIVDCFDALTTRRPYKSAISPFKALKLMQDQMMASFDAKFLYKFVQFLGS